MAAFMYMYEFKAYENEAVHPFKPNPELWTILSQFKPQEVLS